MTDPTLKEANEIETLLREHGYNATVTSASADTLRYSSGKSQTTGLTLTVEVDL